MQPRAHPRDIPPDCRQLCVIGKLLRRLLHAQTELLPQQGMQLGSELVARLCVEVFFAFRSFHLSRSYPRRRCTNVVLIGSLAAASANASRASASSTPSIS